MGRAISPPKNQRSHDMIETPPELAARIVEHFAPSGECLDPCRGEGAFYNALVAEVGLCHVSWCEVTAGRDFLEHYSGDSVLFNYCVTNPPWSDFRRFMLRAMCISNNVVFLGTLTHFITRARLRDVRDHGFGLREAFMVKQPPAPWPSSGFQLAAVHLQRGWTGPLTLTGEM